MYTEIDKIIAEFSAADDSKKNQIADWLKVVKSYPDTELVKALFERETLRTKLAHKEQFVDDCDRIIKSQLKVINNLSQKLEKLTLENEELKDADIKNNDTRPITVEFLKKNFADCSAALRNIFSTTKEQTPLSVDVLGLDGITWKVYLKNNEVYIKTIGQFKAFLRMFGLDEFANNLKV
jgi:GTP cyclohydrolase FolE2